MTSNQINYHRLLEDRRHNKVVEAETKRANKVNAKNTRLHTEMQGRYNDAYLQHLSGSLSETSRHNLATEAKDLLYLTRTADETERHNRANEAISEKQINSNYQIAMGNIALGKSQLAESTRHNEALESLTAKNNEYNYSLGQERNQIENAKRADSIRHGTQQQLLNMQQLDESKRHNRYMESISDRQTTITGVTNTSDQLNKWYKTLTQ